MEGAVWAGPASYTPNPCRQNLIDTLDVLPPPHWLLADNRHVSTELVHLLGKLHLQLPRSLEIPIHGQYHLRPGAAPFDEVRWDATPPQLFSDAQTSFSKFYPSSESLSYRFSSDLVPLVDHRLHLSTA